MVFDSRWQSKVPELLQAYLLNGSPSTFRDFEDIDSSTDSSYLFVPNCFKDISFQFIISWKSGRGIQ
jgi:hypothetical protein